MADNLARIREIIGAQPVKLVAVTKNIGVKGIEEAYNLGVTEFGENRVQDALAKQRDLSEQIAHKIHWHFIGHLQSNKVRQAVGQFVLIHSIDSLRLAQEVSKEAGKRHMVQPILIQVKLIADPGKYGFTVETLHRDFAAILTLPNITVEGLMTIAPLTDDPKVWRQCFAGLRSLRDELSARHGVPLRELSMGMSQDFKEAVSCGSTILRLGRAVFDG